MRETELQVGYWAIAGVCGAAVYLLIKWVANSPTRPDPWDCELTEGLAADAGVPLCHQCLTPYQSSLHFCPACGATVGVCTNLMPPLYANSLGNVMRTATNGDFKHTVFLIGGYFLAAPLIFFNYGMFFLIPFYWFQLMRNIDRHNALQRARIDLPTPRKD